MNMAEERTQIEAVKLAIESLPGDKVSIKDTVAESIEWLLFHYQNTGDRVFLRSALCQMIAWVELGLDYGQNEECFGKVLKLWGISRQDFLSGCGIRHKRMRPTRNRLRNIIGRWRRGCSEDPEFEEVIQDIQSRIRNRTTGRKEYISHYPDGTIFGMYELVITVEENILHDRVRKKYWFFEGKADDACRNRG